MAPIMCAVAEQFTETADGTHANDSDVTMKCASVESCWNDDLMHCPEKIPGNMQEERGLIYC